jgi:soluble lytic murein transglycosylase-like protein
LATREGETVLSRLGDFASAKLTVRRLLAPEATGGAQAAQQPWGIDLFSPSAGMAPTGGDALGTATVQPGETLQRIAARTLGDAGRWRELYDANRDQLPSPYVVFPGTVLKLPSAKAAGEARPEGTPEDTPEDTPKGGLWDMANAIGPKVGVDPKLIMAVVKAESGGNPNARSHVGAQGLMQLMPATARGLGVDDPYDPHQNMLGGAKYLKQLLDKFDGNLKLAIAGYNAGPGAVQKYGGIPPFRETQHYVPKVLSFYRDYGGLA